MLAGPDLLVILGIALIVFGPKKLPELAKTLGKAMGEFKKTTEGMKESIGLKGIEGMGGKIGMDLFTNLAEKVSASMAKSTTDRRGFYLCRGIHPGDDTFSLRGIYLQPKWKRI